MQIGFKKNQIKFPFLQGTKKGSKSLPYIFSYKLVGQALSF